MRVGSLGFFAAAICTAASAAPPRYTLTLLPAGGPNANVPFSINRHHVVVGVAGQQNSGHGALWTKGAVVDLGTGDGLDAEQSSANHVTNAGVIVGSTGFRSDQYQHAAFYKNGGWIDEGTGYPGKLAFSAFRWVNASGVAVGQRSPKVPDVQHYRQFRTYAFTWQDGVFTNISLGGHNGQAFSINDAGLVVGQSETTDRTPHAFAWKSGTLTDLGAATGIAAGFQSLAQAVNKHGQAVGFAVFDPHGTYDAALWQGGKARDLGVLGGTAGASAQGINDAGVVVGYSSTATDPGLHAFVWISGQMYDLNKVTSALPTGIVLEQATAISADGAIVGSTCSQSCPSGAPPPRAFLLTPAS